MAKVHFFDKRIFKIFLEITSGISVVLALAVIFIDIPKSWKFPGAAIFGRVPCPDLCGDLVMVKPAPTIST